MEARFKKGQSVRIIKRNGETIDGIVRDWDYNVCTFGREYNIDYMKDGQIWTVICVPENAIKDFYNFLGRLVQLVEHTKLPQGRGHGPRFESATALYDNLNN